MWPDPSTVPFMMVMMMVMLLKKKRMVMCSTRVALEAMAGVGVLDADARGDGA